MEHVRAQDVAELSTAISIKSPTRDMRAHHQVVRIRDLDEAMDGVVLGRDGEARSAGVEVRAVEALLHMNEQLA